MSDLDVKEGVLEQLSNELTANMHEIILYNDDVNTFDHVIECLINYCDHDVLQAEQCSYIVHYRGKCSVKRGTKEKLVPINKALQEQRLRSKIH
jgi:ATP-dependent Clp protease adaptor protein ClpS